MATDLEPGLTLSLGTHIENLALPKLKTLRSATVSSMQKSLSTSLTQPLISEDYGKMRE